VFDLIVSGDADLLALNPDRHAGGVPTGSGLASALLWRRTAM
jgi:hypothetical protein